MPEENNKRQRVSKACEQCRRKKVKCDGFIPICANCSSLNLACMYKTSTKKRGPPKGYIETIEGRLHRLENLLNDAFQEDDPRAQAIFQELNAPLETAHGELVRPHKENQSYTNHAKDKTHSDSSVEDSRQSENESINDNLGNLSVDENGQVRYYGKSSGFYMLSRSKNFQNGAFHFNTKSHHDSPQPVSVDPFELPPSDLSDHLLDLYFTHFYPLFPLLHKKSFLSSLRDPTIPPPRLLLNSIYAVASRISPDPRVRTVPALADTAGDMFLERARILLDSEWDDFRVSTVQSLLLLSSHQNGALKNIRGWLYSGLAFRMCQNLGLNRNCDSWNLSDAEKEERKRVFYCSFVVDRLSCAMHGRAPMIDERDYDTPYPSEIDDDDKGNSPTIMDNFHQLIKLCEILGDILGQLYMIKGRKQISMMASPDRVISKLDKALNRWMANLPPNVQYKPPNIRLGEKAPVPNLELCQIYMLFYTSLILLHRPFIPGPSQEGTPSVFPSASICTFAANKILDIVESLMAEGRLTKINNYTLYFMFTAGIIFINDALSSDSMFAFEAKISINKIIHAMDEVEKTWITSARHCNILAELAGLRDINLDNIDEHPSSKSTSYSQSLSIAVPNSPALETQNPIELRNPIDAQKSTNQILPAYITQSTSPSVYNQTGYSTPVFPDDLMQDQPFDPIGTAFWGMPMSFDIDEWNSYLSNQNPRQDLSQVQRQDILPNNSNNNMW